MFTDPLPGPTTGFWIANDDIGVLRAIEGSTADFVGIDCQHGIGDHILRRMLEIRSSVPRYVRVADSSAQKIGYALDLGADGIIVPMVNSVEQAKMVTRAAHYPPRGDRSYGPVSPWLSRDVAELDSRVTILVMIETECGLRNAEAILNVDGIDGCYVGPADLGISLGHGANQFPPSEPMRTALSRIADAAQRTRKVAGLHAGDAALAGTFRELGFTMLTLANGERLVSSGIEQQLKASGAEAHSATTNSPY
ncbi:HpcH/HpaI aldolase family protein [Paenarthrobacter nitroguajacolicus]|uniref:HpcH/HpaI aldolase family protein n=1 Tax=Paenarthrobacter nitroguajacolicus TaxID=211146 RepID=UPI00248C0B56|nr:aldolase/citrate lyase family protein [Paenarthrobacter nitroguajacolicus]MDI2034182.1 4-hydroxy-2-oxovalerate aldolase [Paenarthrobacter nitroguajacolicus]